MIWYRGTQTGRKYGFGGIAGGKLGKIYDTLWEEQNMIKIYVKQLK
jgi:hypothetical protein